MKAIVVTAALLIVPFAAQAQIAPRTPPDSGRLSGIADPSTNPAIGRELRETRERIDRGRESGDLSKREARALRRENRQIGVLADRYGRDGISDAEYRELEMRARVLQSQVEAQRIRPTTDDPD
ncbi:hypothetical protein [Pelagerythrobacter aerophilus]|uniref:hypothetical protein n=1 Tax=Pelagerythrobacter aerophilus TaxID=2306995 RepID=UPI0011C44120|nr:hypothetical protein [Pelagerythrobacter aerophilus]